MADLGAWAGAPEPERLALEGQYTHLEPLHDGHERDLFDIVTAPCAADLLRYLPDAIPQDTNVFHAAMQTSIASRDPLFFAVIDKKTGHVGGRQALMHIVPLHGSIEFGHVLWGPAIARSRVATEALFLSAQYVFDVLGYRRFEWKCNSRNEKSKSAALRFGFRYEGVFRNHMVVKGESRDTTWFAMTDEDWVFLKPRFQTWLAPENFDDAGMQRTKLNTR